MSEYSRLREQARILRDDPRSSKVARDRYGPGWRRKCARCGRWIPDRSGSNRCPVHLPDKMRELARLRSRRWRDAHRENP